MATAPSGDVYPVNTTAIEDYGRNQSQQQGSAFDPRPEAYQPGATLPGLGHTLDTEQIQNYGNQFGAPSPNFDPDYNPPAASEVPMTLPALSPAEISMMEANAGHALMGTTEKYNPQDRQDVYSAYTPTAPDRASGATPLSTPGDTRPSFTQQAVANRPPSRMDQYKTRVQRKYRY